MIPKITWSETAYQAIDFVPYQLRRMGLGLTPRARSGEGSGYLGRALGRQSGSASDTQKTLRARTWMGVGKEAADGSEAL